VSESGGEFEVVIGLEVHAHLRTKSKLFSPAPILYGAEPNHSVHPICLALPGVLPVLNERAVELAIRASLAMNCEVHQRSIFARKNYFYPDLPKGYQISQYEEPLATGGWVDTGSGRWGCREQEAHPPDAHPHGGGRRKVDPRRRHHRP